MTKYGDTLEVSNSEIQSFNDCRRRWWLTYHRGLRPLEEKPVGPLAVGSRVHLALEHGYSTPGREEAARKVLAESIAEDYPKAVALGVEKEFLSEAELCLAVLEGFFVWASEEGLDAGWDVVEHERLVKAPPIRVSGQDVILKGKLDQVVRHEGTGQLWMRDWKTTATLKLLMLPFAPQLKTYLLLLQLTEPEAQVNGGVFVFLKKNKRTARAEPPFYLQETVYVSTTERENFWASTLGNLTRIVEATAALDRGEDHHRVVPARPTRDCSWRCPFVTCCEMFDDGSNVELYLEHNYRVSDPYEYYGIDEDNGQETA